MTEHRRENNRPKNCLFLACYTGSLHTFILPLFSRDFLKHKILQKSEKDSFLKFTAGFDTLQILQYSFRQVHEGFNTKYFLY